MSANNKEKQAEIPFGSSGHGYKRPETTVFDEVDQIVWDICDAKAIEADRRLVAKWNNTLQTVIVSAGLYSAVVTAFTIEALRQLAGDPAETTRDILLVISQQLANPSTPPFKSPRKSPFGSSPRKSPDSLSLSSYFFLLSILCSLIAAVIALPALRWVSTYDERIKGYTSRDRATKRGLRDLQGRKRMMQFLVQALPFLLVFSLFLFAGGLASWIGYITEGDFVDTIMGTVWFFGIILMLVLQCLLAFLFRTSEITVEVWSLVTPYIPKSAEALSERTGYWLTAVSFMWMSKPQTNSKCLRERDLEEGEEVMSDSARMISLLWLAHSIDLTPNMRDTLLIVLREITELPAYMLEKSSSFCFENRTWETIFMYLCEPYFGKHDARDYTKKELECAALLCRGLSITTSEIQRQKIKRFVRSLQNETNQAISASAYLADYNQLWHSSDAARLQRLRTGFMLTCRARKSLPPNYFDFILLKIQSAQRELAFVPQEAEITELALTCSLSRQSSYNNSPAHLISIESLHVICDIIAYQMGGKYWGAAIRQYVAIMESFSPREVPEPHFDMFYAILDQIIAHITCINLTGKDIRNKLDPSLDLLSYILDSNFQFLRSNDLTDIFSVMTRLPASHTPVKRILHLIFKRRLDITEGSSLHLETILMFREFMDRRDLTINHRKRAFRSLCYVLHDISPPLSELDEVEQKALTTIDSPFMALVLSLHISPKHTFPALLSPFTERWEDTFSKEFPQSWHMFKTKSKLSYCQSSFLRAIILGASRNLYLSAINLMESRYFNMTNETWQQLITPDVMSKIIEHYMESFEKRGDFSCPLLLKISYFEWFTDLFSNYGDIIWVKVTTNVNSADLTRISEFLMDQIVFSNSMEHLQFWIKSTEGYLQGMAPERRHVGPDNPLPPNSFVNVFREVLVWVLKRSIEGRSTEDGRPEADNELGDLERIATESRRTARNEDGNQVYMKAQKFEFIPALSDQEWEEWIASIKLVLTGMSLGGLGMDPVVGASRHVRDPEGVCNYRNCSGDRAKSMFEAMNRSASGGVQYNDQVTFYL
ncbi:hypothetical protein CPB86DRAFT_830414 [Serendipita vermifera]|nr:hypothetical protein CPB86DRAFT_830414 [Serendipita vermifera]